MNELREVWKRWESAKRSYRRAWKRGVGIMRAMERLNSAAWWYDVERSKREVSNGRAV